MTSREPSEYELHAYLDGGLDEARRAELAAWLARHPAQAGILARWTRDAARLRAALADPAPSPARFDPAALRTRLRARRRARLSMAAGFLLTLGLGGGLGWQLREATQAPAAPPMADAVAAYRLFAESVPQASNAAAGELVSGAELQAWLGAHFGAAGRVPDLQAQGYRLVGGHRLATELGAAAMVFYDDGRGGQLGLYLRPASARAPQGVRRDGALQARYWAHDGVAFAVVAAARDDRAASVQRALQRQEG